MLQLWGKGGKGSIVSEVWRKTSEKREVLYGMRGKNSSRQKSGNHAEATDVRKRIIEKAKAENLDVIEPVEGVLGCENLFLDKELVLFDIREQATAEKIEQAMMQEKESLKDVLRFPGIYDLTYLCIGEPVWLGVDQNTLFYLDRTFSDRDYGKNKIFKVSSASWSDDTKEEQEFTLLKSIKTDAVRIYAHPEWHIKHGEMTDQHYLFDAAGKLLWKADKPIKFSGYWREIGFEFFCNADFKQDSAMLVDFYTGRVLLEGYYAILNYREKGTNRLVLDGVGRISQSPDKYSHKLFYYDDGEISEFTEQEYKITAEMSEEELLLPSKKYHAGDGTRSEFELWSSDRRDDDYDCNCSYDGGGWKRRAPDLPERCRRCFEDKNIRYQK